MAIRGIIGASTQVRFWNKVLKTDACWIWLAAKSDSGYGVFGVGKQTDKAHRIAWRLSEGEIPHKLFVLHRCDNRPCVNPAHLFLGTNHDNVLDMIAKGRNSPPPKMGGWNKTMLLKSIVALLGTEADSTLATKAGCTKHTIRRARNALNIPAFPSQTTFKKGASHPRWCRTEVTCLQNSKS